MALGVDVRNTVIGLLTPAQGKTDISHPKRPSLTSALISVFGMIVLIDISHAH